MIKLEDLINNCLKQDKKLMIKHFYNNRLMHKIKKFKIKTREYKFQKHKFQKFQNGNYKFNNFNKVIEHFSKVQNNVKVRPLHFKHKFLI